MDTILIIAGVIFFVVFLFIIGIIGLALYGIFRSNQQEKVRERDDRLLPRSWDRQQGNGQGEVLRITPEPYSPGSRPTYQGYPGGNYPGQGGYQYRPYAPEPKPDPRLQPPAEVPFQRHSFQPHAELLRQRRTPKILLTPDVFKRMFLYVEIASKEVGWLGTCSRMKNGDFLIDQVFLIEQRVTAVETELSVDGINKLTTDLLEQGDKGMDSVERMRFWGHSHVRMGTTPSGTDESTMVRFGNDGCPWYIRGIFNKLGRAEFSIYLYDQGYRILDAEWAVWDPETRSLIEHASLKKSSWPVVWGNAILAKIEEATVLSTPTTPAGSATSAQTPAQLTAPTAPTPLTTGAASPDQPVTTISADVAGAEGTATTGSANDASNAVPATPAPQPEPKQVVIPKVSAIDLLPEQLRPDDVLREEVYGEYAAKVKERTFSSWGSDEPFSWTKWWTRRNEEEEAEQIGPVEEVKEVYQVPNRTEDSSSSNLNDECIPPNGGKVRVKKDNTGTLFQMVNGPTLWDRFKAWLNSTE